MHICIITSSFPANELDVRAAAGLFVRDFSLVLRNKGYHITILTPDKLTLPKHSPQGIDVTWFPWAGGKKRLSYMKPYNPVDALSMISLFRNGRRTLLQINSRKKIDLVIAMWAVPAGELARFLFRTQRVPYVVWCLGSDIWTYGRYPFLKGVVAGVLQSSLKNYADGIELARKASCLSKTDCCFLPSARLVDLKQPYCSKKDTLRFVFVGRYAKVKAPEILLQAFRKYLSTGKKGELILFGGGPLERTLRNMIQKNNLQSAVTLHGYESPHVIGDTVDKSDVQIIPSRMESIPLVLSDALQRGKPVIVTDAGDMGKLVREYDAGEVVAVNDSEDLCRAMVKMSTDGLTLYERGVAALATKFDLNHSADTILRNIIAGQEETYAG